MSLPRYAPLLVLVVAGCTPSPDARPVPPTTAAVPGDSRLIACEPTEAHQTTSRTAGPADVTAGALTWPGLAGWADGSPDLRGDGDGNYKIGAVIAAGAVVTVSVPPSHRKLAGLSYGQSASYSPTPAVTFQACAYADTAYIGGFHVEGRQCVPFDVTEAGRPPVRITVSFFAGTCP